jgi:hypothetical protein
MIASLSNFLIAFILHTAQETPCKNIFDTSATFAISILRIELDLITADIAVSTAVCCEKRMQIVDGICMHES